jgi:beta-glucosidase
MGWPVDPASLTAVLSRLSSEYGVQSLVITENGAAFDDSEPVDGEVQDPERAQYLYEHLEALATAIEAGVPVDGYFVWSLLDNFEWAHGYSKRFGIVYVDFSSQQRTVKSSGNWYRRVIENHSLHAPPGHHLR